MPLTEGVNASRLWKSLLEELPASKRDDAPLRDDDVIQDADPEQIPALEEALGDGQVFLRGFRISRWVVVNQNK